MIISHSIGEVSTVEIAGSYARCIGAAVFAPAAHNALELRTLEERLLPGATYSSQLSNLALAEVGRGYVPTDLNPEEWGSVSIGREGENAVAERREAAVVALTGIAKNLAPSGWLHRGDALAVYATLADALRMMCGRDAEGKGHAESVLSDVRISLVRASDKLPHAAPVAGRHGSHEARSAIERVWPAIGGRNFYRVPAPRQAPPLS